MSSLHGREFCDYYTLAEAASALGYVPRESSGAISRAFKKQVLDAGLLSVAYFSRTHGLVLGEWLKSAIEEQAKRGGTLRSQCHVPESNSPETSTPKEKPKRKRGQRVQKALRGKRPVRRNSQ